ncbi:MAG TPA: putative metal-dependent hydrolase [Bryobacteraceae bacterium]|jgi:hypothetical protein|nr:putative metal-dependent hydrolase [Bryobacteraceae bacterium]
MSTGAVGTDPRYPVGRFPKVENLTEAERNSFIGEIAAAPALFRAAVAGLSPQQLDTPYREGGWTVRQVIHHVPDSHMNAFIRFKLALTEAEPVIKPYNEAAWATLNDAVETPVETSLTLLERLHERWVILLRGISAEDWKRAMVHPEMGRLPLEQVLAIYAWHGKHHTAHVTELRKRMDW